ACRHALHAPWSARTSPEVRSVSAASGPRERVLPLEGENGDGNDEHGHAVGVRKKLGARRARHQEFQSAGALGGCQLAWARPTAWSTVWPSISQACPKWLIASMMGSNAAPLSVSSYSTRGGDSG